MRFKFISKVLKFHSRTRSAAKKTVKIEPVEASQYFNNQCKQDNFNDLKLEEEFTQNVKKEQNELENISLKLEPSEGSSNLKKTKWEPIAWQEQFERIKKMRENQNAPVDTMGCDALSSVEPTITPQVLKI